MVAKRILITGANRGLGLEFVKQLVASQNPPELLFVTCRDPGNAKELNATLKSASNIKAHVLKLDANNEADLQEVARTVIKDCGTEGLNLLINNAGVMDKSIIKPEDVTMKNMMEHYMTNTVSPTILTSLLLPALRAAASHHQGGELSCSRAAVVHITTFLASIAEVKESPANWYPYRASKTALNMVAKCMAVDLQKDHILVIPLHPGWAKTDMGGSDAAITPEQSVHGMLQVMKHATTKDTGVYVGWDGKTLSW